MTLSSIGDAVIGADAEGRVNFMNGVAAGLTGWRQAAGGSRPQTLGDAFQIVNEHTREPADNLALRALQAGTVVALGNHAVLFAGDGTERPIDNSAAPMREGERQVGGSRELWAVPRGDSEP